MNPYSPPAVAPATYPSADMSYGSSHSGAASEAAVELLRQTRPWVVMLSIFLFVGSAFMLLVGLALVAWGMFAPGAKATQAAIGVVYVPLALVYIYPGIKLWSYGAAIARLMNSRAGADLEDALGQQKSFWKFSGIASLVFIGLYAIGIIALIAVGALAAAGLGKLGQ